MGQLSQTKVKDKRLQKIYNRSLEDYNRQLAEQGNACAICGRSFSQFQAYNDHDHKCCPRRLKEFCGKCNRGILCYLCNKYAVGLIEWMRKMGIPFKKIVEYVDFWDAEIKRKGGYESKPKSAKKWRAQKAQADNRLPEKQKSV